MPGAEPRSPSLDNSSLPGALPDFLIIGAQKSGTSSLYAYLRRHPQIRRARQKEVHFFDRQFGRQGIDWYRGFFPARSSPSESHGSLPVSITGEATPIYIFHPLVPERVAETIPAVKLIAILRNPVDRAYSHYHHERRAQRESLSFGDALAAEDDRVDGEVAKIMADDTYHATAFRTNSYKARGIYVDQLQRWRVFFPAQQMLVLETGDLKSRYEQTMRQTVEFLGLSPCAVTQRKWHNAHSYPPMDPGIREQLVDYFAPHNERLYEFLGVDYGWS
jgi:hypothetical protein